MAVVWLVYLQLHFHILLVVFKSAVVIVNFICSFEMGHLIQYRTVVLGLSCFLEPVCQ